MLALFLSLVVCSTCELKDIQSAVNLAKAGERIIVKAGNYKGPVLIKKSLEIVGEGEPVIEGGGKHQVITVMADGVRIEGLVINLVCPTQRI